MSSSRRRMAPRVCVSFVVALAAVIGYVKPAGAQLTFQAMMDGERGKAEVRIDDSDIASVVIRERRETATQSGQIVAGEPYYQITFVLRPRGANRLNEFLTNRVGQRLGVRLGGTELGTVRVVEPFSGNEYTTYFKDKRADVERMLGPVKDRLIWK